MYLTVLKIPLCGYWKPCKLFNSKKSSNTVNEIMSPCIYFFEIHIMKDIGFCFSFFSLLVFNNYISNPSYQLFSILD